jgi:hypothetical protein
MYCRVVLKLFACAILMIILILFAKTDVDFVYTGF